MNPDKTRRMCPSIVTDIDFLFEATKSSFDCFYETKAHIVNQEWNLPKPTALEILQSVRNNVFNKIESW